MSKTDYIKSGTLRKYQRVKYSLPGKCLSKKESVTTVIQLTKLWKSVLDFTYVPETVIWKSMGAPLGCSSHGKKWTIFINPSRLALNKIYLNYAVLHEFSHMLLGESEYKATRFALSVIKTYYSEDYFKAVCREIKKRLSGKYRISNPIEYSAYRKALRLIGA